MTLGEGPAGGFGEGAGLYVYGCNIGEGTGLYVCGFSMNSGSGSSRLEEVEDR